VKKFLIKNKYLVTAGVIIILATTIIYLIISPRPFIQRLYSIGILWASSSVVIFLQILFNKMLVGKIEKWQSQLGFYMLFSLGITFLILAFYAGSTYLEYTFVCPFCAVLCFIFAFYMKDEFELL
jgi:hypothetical protein